jgi:hypothetical protein
MKREICFGCLGFFALTLLIIVYDQTILEKVLKTNFESIQLFQNQSQIPSIRTIHNVQTAREKSNLDCFNLSTCVLFYHTAYERSGNRLIQLLNAEHILSQRSGAAISQSTVNDDVVSFAPIQIFGRKSCNPAWDNVSVIETLFNQLQTRCTKMSFVWDRTIRKAPGPFGRLVLKNFPTWLNIDLRAWSIPLNSSIAVMHFRGGDVFNRKPSPYYVQPVCDHYVESFHHSHAKCALLLSEDNLNPCIHEVRRRINCTFAPQECGPACALTLLLRASILISSNSTFVKPICAATPSVRRAAYFPFCPLCPLYAGACSTFCTNIDAAGLLPWTASPTQLELLKAGRATVAECPPPPPDAAAAAR